MKRRAWCLGLVLVGLILGLLVTGVKAQEKAPSAEFSVDLLSQYIWRGIGLSKDSLVIQPSATVAYQGVYVNFWANYDTDQESEHDPSLDGAEWNETDFTLGYTLEDLPYGLSLEIGTIYYALEGTDDSFEVFTSLSGTCPKTGIDLGVTLYREISHYPAWWLEVSLGREFPLPWYSANLALSLSAMYLSSDDEGAYYDPDDPTDEFSGWLYAQIGAEISLPLGKYFTLTPKVYYSFSLSDDADRLLEDLSWDNHHDHFYGGVGLSMSF